VPNEFDLPLDGAFAYSFNLSFGGPCVPSGAEHEGDCLAGGIDRAVEVRPFPFDFHMGLIRTVRVIDDQMSGLFAREPEGGFAPGFLLFDSLLTLHASRLCFARLPFTAEARIKTIETKHKGLRYRNTRTGDHYGRHK
jgi:hypothetical protein